VPAPHPPEFRQRAVGLARLGEQPVAATARDLRISESCRRTSVPGTTRYYTRVRRSWDEDAGRDHGVALEAQDDLLAVHVMKRAGGSGRDVDSPDTARWSPPARPSATAAWAAWRRVETPSFCKNGRHVVSTVRTEMTSRPAMSMLDSCKRCRGSPDRVHTRRPRPCRRLPARSGPGATTPRSGCGIPA
jgi:hypothetical protein